jgi:5-methylcytosine-specific restriction endonuclease McrA
VYPWIKKERNRKQLQKQKDGLSGDREKWKHFYNSSQWHDLRLVVLSEDPICKICQREYATEVDHIIPFALNSSLRLAHENLQGLCSTYHKRKTVNDSKIIRDKEREDDVARSMNELNEV